MLLCFLLIKEGTFYSPFRLGDSGRLDNKTIESKMLIDNHYYAIANKASLTKPKDLNPPAQGWMRLGHGVVCLWNGWQPKDGVRAAP